MVYPQTVNHLSINQTRRWVTSLMCPTPACAKQGVALKPRPHQRHCRQKPRHCRRNRQHCCQKHNVAGFCDNVAVFGDNAAVLGATMSPVSATLSLVWTGLTGCNTTGSPSRAAPWWVTLHMRRRWVLQTMTTTNDDHRRRQTPHSITNLSPTLHVGGPVIITHQGFIRIDWYFFITESIL